MRQSYRLLGYFLLSFGLAAALYWGSASYFQATSTPDVAYFNHLAAAFLQGRTELIAPPSTHDLTQFRGRWYVPFPPLPALLMMPAIALVGLTGLNTVLFAAIFGGLNVALVLLLLLALRARGWSRLGLSDNLWLTLLFGLGSVHWYMATIGSVWFVAQICTVTFLALAAWLAVAHNHAWLAGIALALAMLARPTVALTWPLLLGIAAMHLQTRHGHISWRPWLGWAIRSLIPPLVAVAGLLYYNQIRFADPFDFGYLTANVAADLAADLHTYGQFHWHYLPKNFWAMLLAGPQWNEQINFWDADGQGMSLFLTTPALILLGRARQRTPLVIGAWLALGLVMIPLLLYYNTGWWQFGYRFSLDFMVPIMVLLAMAAGTRLSWPLRGLILVGVAVNLYGLIWWHG